MMRTSAKKCIRKRIEREEEAGCRGGGGREEIAGERGETYGLHWGEN